MKPKKKVKNSYNSQYFKRSHGALSSINCPIIVLGIVAASRKGGVFKRKQ